MGRSPSRRSKLPEPGDLLLVSGHGPIERLVEWSTVSPFSHVAMSFREGAVVESKEGHGVRLVSTDLYPDSKWYRVRCDQTTRDAALAFALSKLGQPYGWREALDDGLRDILHVGAGTRWQAFRHYDCSALCVAAYAKAGLVLTYRPVPAPADLVWSPLVEPI